MGLSQSEKSIRQQIKDGDISRTERDNIWAINKGYKNYSDYTNHRNYKTGKCKPMSENKECSLYLGVHISERILSDIFDNVIRMPNGNKGYDFICGKGYKIDVKSACTRKNYDSWDFVIKQNKIADYFLLLLYDNISSDKLLDDLNPLCILLIKSNEIIRGRRFNRFKSFKVSKSKFFELSKYVVIDKTKALIERCSKLKDV